MIIMNIKITNNLREILMSLDSAGCRWADGSPCYSEKEIRRTMEMNAGYLSVHDNGRITRGVCTPSNAVLFR